MPNSSTILIDTFFLLQNHVKPTKENSSFRVYVSLIHIHNLFRFYPRNPIIWTNSTNVFGASCDKEVHALFDLIFTDAIFFSFFFAVMSVSLKSDNCQDIIRKLFYTIFHRSKWLVDEQRVASSSLFTVIFFLYLLTWF